MTIRDSIGQQRVQKEKGRQNSYLAQDGDREISQGTVSLGPLNLVANGVVCDNVTDNHVVLTALAATAVATNRVLYLPATPEPCVTSSIGILSASLFGDGSKSVLVLAKGASAGLMQLGVGVSLRSITLDGNALNNFTPTNLLTFSGDNAVDDVIMRQSRGTCAYIADTTDELNNTVTSILNSKLLGCYVRTVLWSNASHIQLSNNSYICCNGPGDAPPAHSSFDVSIRGGRSASNVNGFELSSDITGGFLDGSKAYTSGVSITNVLIEDNLYYGILSVANKTIISNNTLLNNGRPSIKLNGTNQAIVVQGDGAIITDNLIDGAGGDGIDLGGATECLVTRNKIENVNSYGIEINSAQNCKISHNTVRNAWLGTSFAGVAHAGIYSGIDRGSILPSRRLPASGNVIDNNLVLHPSRPGMTHGILIDDDGVGGKTRNGQVVDNTASGFGPGAGIIVASPTVAKTGNKSD